MTQYVTFGVGRVGPNIATWLEHIGHDVTLLTHKQARDARDTCPSQIADADIVCAAIPDRSLAAWREEWNADIDERPAINFSGAAHVEHVWVSPALFVSGNCARPRSIKLNGVCLPAKRACLHRDISSASEPAAIILLSDRGPVRVSHGKVKGGWSYGQRSNVITHPKQSLNND